MLGKIQPSERYNEVVLGCVTNKIRILPLRRDDHSGVLIGQRACRLMTSARESIDSTLVGKSSLLTELLQTNIADRRFHDH